MAIFAFILKDDGDQGATRQRLLMDHLRYVDTIVDKMVLAGPCPPSEAGDTRQFAGSIVMFRADTAEQARALAEGDPYFKAGVWKSCEMMRFSPAAGELCGGKTWELVGDSFRMLPNPIKP